jgi:hypothetical protein
MLPYSIPQHPPRSFAHSVLHNQQDLRSHQLGAYLAQEVSAGGFGTN